MLSSNSAHAPIKRAHPAYTSRTISPTHIDPIIGMGLAAGKRFFRSLSRVASDRKMRALFDVDLSVPFEEADDFTFCLPKGLPRAVARGRALRSPLLFPVPAFAWVVADVVVGVSYSLMAPSNANDKGPRGCANSAASFDVEKAFAFAFPCVPSLLLPLCVAPAF